MNDEQRLRAGIRSLSKRCQYCSKAEASYPLILSDDARLAVYHATCAAALASENLLRQEPVKRLELLTALQSSLQHLARTIHQTEPDSHLEITWKHFELGAMHWREWLLLARMHLLDHVRQLQTIRVEQCAANAIEHS